MANYTGTEGNDTRDAFAVGEMDQTNSYSGLGGDDILYGGNLADQLYGGDGDDQLAGRGGDDEFITAGGLDTVSGDAGDDSVLVGSSGTLTFDGGDGLDMVDYSQTSGVSVNLATNATGRAAAGDSLINVEDIFGSNFDDAIIGTAAANRLFGNGGADTINGGDGDDFLDGGDGADRVSGGAGADNIGGGGGNDVLYGGAGDDVIYTNGSSDFSPTREQAFGQDGDDTFAIETGRSTHLIDGGAGDQDEVRYGGTEAIGVNLGTGATSGGAAGDMLRNIERLSGGDGDDTLVGSAGDNYLSGGFGDDTVSGGAGDDQLAGSNGDDRLNGGAGDDSIYGDNGDDIVVGGAGADVLVGGGPETGTFQGGVDLLSYTGSDAGVIVTLVADEFGQSFQKGGDAEGDRTIGFESALGSSFGDSLTGNADVNALYGAGGADSLNGGGGDDVLSGGDGADRLIGSTGADRLVGGAGADRFVYGSTLHSTVAASGRDAILDFSRAEGDRIDLSLMDANTRVAGDQAFRFIGEAAFTGAAGQLRYGEGPGGDSYLYADVDGDRSSDFVIRVTDVASFAAGDFVL